MPDRYRKKAHHSETGWLLTRVRPASSYSDVYSCVCIGAAARQSARMQTQYRNRTRSTQIACESVNGILTSRTAWRSLDVHMQMHRSTYKASPWSGQWCCGSHVTEPRVAMPRDCLISERVYRAFHLRGRASVMRR